MPEPTAENVSAFCAATGEKSQPDPPAVTALHEVANGRSPFDHMERALARLSRGHSEPVRPPPTSTTSSAPSHRFEGAPIPYGGRSQRRRRTLRAAFGPTAA